MAGLYIKYVFLVLVCFHSACSKKQKKPTHEPTANMVSSDQDGGSDTVKRDIDEHGMYHCTSMKT